MARPSGVTRYAGFVDSAWQKSQKKPRKVAPAQASLTSKQCYAVDQPDGLIAVLWTFPLTPPSLNAWQDSHWGSKDTIKKRWYAYMEQALMLTDLPKFNDWITMSGRIVFPRNAHRDVENYRATLSKIVGDGLQHVKLLKDDTDAFFRVTGVTIDIEPQAVNGQYKGYTQLALVVAPRLVLL